MDRWTRCRTSDASGDAWHGLLAMGGRMDVRTTLGEVGRTKQLCLLGEKASGVAQKPLAKASGHGAKSPTCSVDPRC